MKWAFFPGLASLAIIMHITIQFFGSASVASEAKTVWTIMEKFGLIVIILQLTIIYGALSEHKSENIKSQQDSSSKYMIRISSKRKLEDNNESLSQVNRCFNSTDCHFGHYCIEGNCSCGPHSHPHHDVFSCQDTGLSVVGCYCVTYNVHEQVIEIGKYLFNCANVHADNTDPPYIQLPKTASELNDFICGHSFNRTGTLCGECVEGLYPLAYSYNMSCVECPHGRNNWWKYLLVAFLPLTIFYFIVMLFKISVNLSNLQAYVYFSQAITMTGMARVLLLATKDRPNVQMATRILGSLYDIWNLNFFRFFDMGICLGTNTLQTLTLDLIVGIYPLLLIVLSYILINMYDRNFKVLKIMWKPFHSLFSLCKRNWDIRTSLIDAFATFFLLCNVKILNVSFDLLIPIHVKQVNSTGQLTFSWRLFYDASIVYFGRRHLPYAIVAMLVLSLFVLLPTLLFIMYPFMWFQKTLNLFPFRWYILHTFMDSFQGCYKDGTDPSTHDCRWFASILFTARFCLFLVGMFVLNTQYFCLAAAYLVVITIILINVQPFKSSMSHYTDSHVVFFLLLALWYAGSLAFEISTTKYPALSNFSLVFTSTAGSLPLLYATIIILYWIFSHKTFGIELISKISAWKQGYHVLE